MARLTGGRAFAALTFAFTVAMLGTTMPTPLYTIYQERFGFSLSMSTVIFAVYAVGVLAALLGVGGWSDTIGRRPMLVAGLAFGIASDLVFLVAGDTAVLLLGRLLSGLSAGIVVGTATAAVVEAAPPAWHGRASSVATAANIGGLGLGPLVAALLVDVFPWPVHLTFVVHLVLALTALTLVLSVQESVPRVEGARPRVQRPTVPAQARTVFTGAAIASFAAFAVTGFLTAVSPRLVAQTVTAPSALVAVSVVVALMLSSVVAQVTLNRMPSDRGVDLGCALLVVGMVVFVMAARAESYPLMLLAALIAGPGQGLAFAKGVAAVLSRVEAHQRAATSSALFVVGYVAISIPVVGGGIAAQSWGLQPAAEFFATIVGLLAVVALAILVADQRRTLAGR